MEREINHKTRVYNCVNGSVCAPRTCNCAISFTIGLPSTLECKWKLEPTGDMSTGDMPIGVPPQLLQKTAESLRENIINGRRSVNIMQWYIDTPSTTALEFSKCMKPAVMGPNSVHKNSAGVDGTTNATIANVRYWKNKLNIHKQQLSALFSLSNDTYGVALFAILCMARGASCVIKLPNHINSATASVLQLLCTDSDSKLYKYDTVYLHVTNFGRNREIQNIARQLLRADMPDRLIGKYASFEHAFTRH